MRRATALLLLAAFLPLAVHADAAAPDVRIAELLPSPDATLGQREFIELVNAGAADVDLDGWRIRDAPTASNATNEYTFGAVRLAPGQRIVVWSNGSADAFGPAWSASASKAVWNDAGDAATLLDADGAVRDWVGYGSASQPPPAGFTAKPAAPAKGKSIALGDAGWAAGEPTPGLAPGQQGGALAARVVNVPPVVTLGAPASVRPGEALALRVTVGDGNGAADVASWTVSANGQAVRQGNGSLEAVLAVPAPAHSGVWTLSATATDAGGLTANATVTVTVRQARLAVAMPAGGALRFPDLRPGDRNVTSLDSLTLRNDGDDAARPLVDVSPLRAGAAAIGVEGNLWLGVTSAGATTWLRYDAPLQALPELAPGQSAALALRIGEVPLPSAAGLYGTTFTVVAA